MSNTLRENYLKVRKQSEEICRPLATEDYIPQPIESVSPPKWHLAHSSWFFEYFILIPFSKDYKAYHPQFNFLFNSYYNYKGIRIHRANRGDMSRPTVREVYAYRRQIDESMLDLITKGVSEEVEKLIEIGLNHEQQHQELLIYDIKYILGTQVTSPVYDQTFIEKLQIEEQSKWIEMEGGLYEVGKDEKEKGFSYDNESPKQKQYLNDFAIQSQLVSNEEFIVFIEDGGYQNHQYWHSEAWEYVKENQLSHPLYWQQSENEWLRYSLSGLKPIDKKEAVMHVSFYEAAAFATWKEARLPSEFEWEIASDQFKWGKLWEWTNSAYLPYPGYQAAKGALGEYNGKFMLNQMVLKGGSIATPEGHSRKTYRNFYHANSRWIFSGIRLSKDI
jgi:ergothioneine biosynthesis protein EgtB